MVYNFPNTKSVFLPFLKEKFILPEEIDVFLKDKPHSSLHELSDTSVSNRVFMKVLECWPLSIFPLPLSSYSPNGDYVAFLY